MARKKPPYSPNNNPWKISDWRKESNYPNPQDMSRERWGWEFLRRQEEYRADWQRYAQLMSVGNMVGKQKKSNCSSASNDLAPYLEATCVAAKYRVTRLPHPGDLTPPIYPKKFQAKNELPIELERGMVPSPNPEMTGNMVKVPCPIGQFSTDGDMDEAELRDDYDLTNWVLDDHWGLHYILFPHEVVLRLDLRTSEVEQLCHRVVEQFPQLIFPSSDPQLTGSPRTPSSKGTISPGQTVPELGWKIGLQELSTWKGPVTAPRLILDPHTPGIVHVIFDLMQPKLSQWKAAKQWLVKIQADQVGTINKQRADPYTWLKYLRVLDAWDFNPDPENLSVTYEIIGDKILGIKDDNNKKRARAKQDHSQAQRLLAHFPY